MKKLLAGLALAALLLSRPAAAANAARDALNQWYAVVAPALFPFMALLPLLTSPESLHYYEALLGGFTRRVLRLPGSAASAMAVGLLAGSPAGCMAARRVSGGMTRNQLERLAAACCGLSPAFLISGVGAGLLGDPGAGLLLLRSQIAAQLTLLTLPVPGPDRPLPPMELSGEDRGPLGGAVRGVLNVAGYMALFAALAGALGQWAGPQVGRWALCLMDVTGGARVLCAARLDAAVRLPLLSALIGFGGGCIAAQNLSALRNTGVRAPRFLARRALAAALSALFTRLQWLCGSRPLLNFTPDMLKTACLCAALLTFPGIIRGIKHSFNNEADGEIEG